MRGVLTAALAACTAVFSAAAQPPQIVVTAGDSIPQTTVVPVQEPAVHVAEQTTVYATPAGRLTHAERRALRAEHFAAGIDSLIGSRNYMFFPNSMQEAPRGMIRNIYAGFFFFGLFVDHVQVHLPTERGLTQYVEMLNFDSEHVRNYQASRVPWGWKVTFNVMNGVVTYAVDMSVMTSTGETVLTLQAPSYAMRYVGWLWDRRPHDGQLRQ